MGTFGVWEGGPTPGEGEPRIIFLGHIPQQRLNPNLALPPQRCRPRALPLHYSPSTVWFAWGGTFWVVFPLHHQVSESRLSDGLGSPGRRLP